MNCLAAEAVLATPRLRLEPLRREHARSLFPGFADPALYRYLPQYPPDAVTELDERYARLESRRSPDGREWWLNWVLRERDGEACLGLIEASVDAVGAARLAYFIFSAYQGRGFASEACDAVLRQLRDGFAAETVTVVLDSRNDASRRLVERLGFSRVAVRPNADFFKGRPSDEYHYRWQWTQQ